MAEVSLTGAQMLTVLEVVASKGPISAASIARVCDINRTVAHRLLVTLAQRSYVRRGEQGYTLGPTVLYLAQSADKHVRNAMKPIIDALAQGVGETVVVHGITDLEAVVLDQAIAQNHLVRVEHSPGSRHSLSVGASGWSLLAFQSERTIEKILAREKDVKAARDRIDHVRTEGYDVSHDELQQGAHGIAVPILSPDNHCEMSLAILVPTNRSGRILDFLPALRAAAQSAAQAIWGTSATEEAAAPARRKRRETRAAVVDSE